jgi:glycosyltransferase involved in cell wall biosynthesis
LSAGTPRVSVCIPTWNGARYLGETLASLAGQDAEGLEIVVADDASTDDTLEVARAVVDPRLRVVAHPDRLGIPGNWGRALASTQADKVLVLLQDDVLFPGAVSSLVEAMEAAPSSVLAFGRREIRREEGDGPEATLLGRTYVAAQEAFYASLDGPLCGVDLVRGALAVGRDLNLNVIGEPSFVLLRQSALRRAGGFDPRLRQLVDWELWLRLAGLGPMSFVDRVLGAFRVHAGGASARNQRTPRTAWEHVRVLRTVERVYGARLSPAERGQVSAARGRYRRHVVGEALRWLLRAGAPA